MSNPVRAYKYLDLVMAWFVAVLIISNIASSAKIVDTTLSIFSLPLAFDGGTLLFPLSYIFGDILTEVYGYKISRRVIWTGFSALALTAFVFFVLQRLPGDAFWQEYAGDAAYAAILGGLSSGGIVLASLLAYLGGSFVNAIVLAVMKIKSGGRFLWARTIGSTLVGQFVDTGLFILIATLFGVFGWELFWSLLLTNYLLKCLIEAAMTPLTYKVVGFLKKSEGVDAYDSQTNFNPFSRK